MSLIEMKCCHCKLIKPRSEYRLTNNCGEWCNDCWDAISKKRLDARLKKDAATNGICKYCGRPAEYSADNYTTHVCALTTKMRAHILDCIRYSDLLARHVAAMEEREAPARLERKKAEAASLAVKIVSPLPEIGQSIPTTQEARMARIELMLNKLMKGLGE